MVKRNTKRSKKKFKKNKSTSLFDDYTNSQKNRFKNGIRKLNPDIFHFTKYSSFIYEPLHSSFFYDKLSDRNSMKPNKDEILFLTSLINSYKETKNKKLLFVLPFFKDLIDNIIPIPNKISNRAQVIKDIVLKLGETNHISLNRIANSYNEYATNNNQKIIHKTTIYNILKNELKFRYKKTTVKTYKLLTDEYKKYCFFFLKILIRGLRLGLDVIYVDESGFYTKNENYYTWRVGNNEFYHHIEDNGKANLLIGVSRSKIIKYKIIKEPTNSENFFKFMEEMVNSMTNEEKENSIIVMDNCTSHLTPQMFQFYSEHKMKILFNIPYKSTFNMVENIFRFIKNLTYKNLYNNIEDLIKGIKNILNGEEILNCLNKLYFETLLVYKDYIDSNINFNLNI